MTKSLLPAGCIVVGVDGSPHAERALAWAAHQAAAEARPLALVHSSETLSVRGASWVDAPGIDHQGLNEGIHAASRLVLDHARKQAEQAAPGLTVLTELLDADPRDALVDLSASAHMVVVGSRGRGPLRSAVLGSVSAAVAKHALCPVVVSRPHDVSHPLANRIVVGADGSECSRPVLEFAFGQASQRGLPLTVMYCFWDAATATRGPGVVRPGEEGLADLHLLLAESVAGFAEKYPDVEVTQELARGLVDECLADQMPEADLIVVGRSTPDGWPRFLHVSCALAVLERAHTAVAVVPEAPEERK
jgi:nucleotide-binding universal stress UspA family protein